MVGFLLGGFLMFVGMLGCCALALLCYPHYPSTYVPEWLANSFTLPAVILVIACWWFPRPTADRKPFFKKWTYILLVTYVAGIGLARWATIWPYRRALPWSAKDIHERYLTESLLPDYQYYLKARISRDEFLDYVGKYGLKKGGDISHSQLNGTQSWWSPAEGAETYSFESDRTSMHAAYSDGYIYVEADRTY